MKTILLRRLGAAMTRCTVWGVQLAALCVTPLAAQGTDGHVGEPARSYLNIRYNPLRERGYCITHWYVTDAGTVVVDSVVESSAQFESAERAAIFLCPAGQSMAHTHPPDKPTPSDQDQQTALVELGLPFVLVQSGWDRFAFLIVEDRVNRRCLCGRSSD